MSKGILGPTVVTLCLGCIGGFHCLKSIHRSSYDDANKNAGELLQKENFELSTFEDGKDEIWNTIIDAYGKANDDEIFEGLSKEDAKNKANLKAECDKVIGKQTKSLSSYNKARRWCVVPQTTKERLKFDGRVALNTAKEDGWLEIAQNYVEKGLKTFNIKEKTEAKAIVTVLQRECDPLLKEQNLKKDFDTSYEKTKRYCSTRE